MLSETKGCFLGLVVVIEKKAKYIDGTRGLVRLNDARVIPTEACTAKLSR